MTTKNKATRHSCSYSASMSTETRDTHIITEFVHGSKLAGAAFVAMFAFLALGVVVFGW